MPRTRALIICGLVLVSAAALCATSRARALEEVKDEKSKRKACEQRLCDAIVKKGPAAGELDCALTKTWARKSLKENSASHKVSWSFGDARCAVDLKLPRALIVTALTQPEVKLELPLHNVKCEIEREKEITHVQFTLGPKVSFQQGQAKKVWINLKHVEGPSAIKGLAVTVAKLEDSVGLFQKDLVKGINTFMIERCPTVAHGH